MNLRTKAFGLLAGTAFSLSLISGVMAADSPASATLQDNATGDCSVSITGGSFALGTFTWDGDGYTGGTTGTLNLSVDQTMSSQNQDCFVTISGGLLTQRDELGAVVVGGATIQADLLVEGVAGPATVDTATGGTTAGASASVTPGATLPPADYAGTVTISASKSAG